MAQYQIKTPLTLFGDPQKPLHAVTKRYVDAKVAAVDGARFQTGVLSLDKLPALSGDVTSSAGSNIVNLVDSGVVAGIKFRVDVDTKGRITGGDTTHKSQGQQISWNWVINKPTKLSGYGITDVVSTAGGTSTAAIASGVTPTASLHAVRRTDVDNKINSLSLTALTPGDIYRSPIDATPAGMLRVNGGSLSKAAYPQLYSIIGDQETIIVDTTTSGGDQGLPWQNQHLFNNYAKEIQDFKPYKELTATGVSNIFAVVKNKIYFFNPGDNGVTGKLYSSSLVNGIASPLVVETSFTMPAYQTPLAIVATKTNLYLLGTSSYYNYSGAVPSYSGASYRIPINVDGSLGQAVTFTTPIQWNNCPFIIKDKLYYIGGATNAYNDPYTSEVKYTTINSDGSIGTWTSGPSLPVQLASHYCVVIKNYVYVLGGQIYNTVGNSVSSNLTVYRANIDTSGLITGSWSNVGTMSYTFYSGRNGVPIITKNRFIVPIWNAGVSPSPLESKMASCSIDAAGVLKLDWTYTDVPFNSGTAGTWFVVSGYVYVYNEYGRCYRGVFKGGTDDYLYLMTNNRNVPIEQFKLPDFTQQEKDGLFYYIKY